MIHRLYHWTTRLGGPAINWYLHRRLRRGKEDLTRFTERQGKATLARPSGPLIWFHGASVGEAQSLLPLIERLTETHPATILLTTGTVTSARLLAHRLPAKAIHQFVPVDRPDWVKSFLDHWQPQLAIWSESDFWPNLLEQTHDRQIPMVLLQGRISPRSFVQWQRIPKFISHILSHFDLCLAQSPTDAERLTRLGAHGVNYVGNLKLAVAPLPVASEHLETLHTQIGQRHLWVAASTHPGEEEVAARIHHALKSRYPDLLTIIIPRHTTRTTAIAEQVKQLGLNVAIRSLDQPLAETTDIYLADTMGELGLFFRIAPIVFMGKSLCAEGGQNPFEPASLGAAILFGPRMSNFPDMCNALLAAGGARQVADEADLQTQLNSLFQDISALERHRQAALSWAKSEAGILDRFVLSLSPFLDRLHARP